MTAAIIAATAQHALITAEPNTAMIAFSDLGIASENMRAKNAADNDIPPLARTVAVARNVVPIIVRPGKGKDEPTFAILDGRRRYLAVKHLIESGEADATFTLKAEILTDPLAIQQALVLANSQRLTPHVADVIATIGGLKAQKGKPMKPAQIAKALGYDAKDVKHIWHLADSHPDVLKALRADKITIPQAKRIARLPNKEQQSFFANQALQGLDWQSQLTRTADRIDINDNRMRLVGLEAYVAAGGQTRADFFDELEEEVLNPEILDATWHAKLQPLVDELQNRGLTVFLGPVQSHEIPEGFERLDYVYRSWMSDAQKEILAPLDDLKRTAEDIIKSSDFDMALDTAPNHLADWVLAKQAVLTAEHEDERIDAVRLYAHSTAPFFETTFFASPEVEEDEPELQAGAGGNDEAFLQDEPAAADLEPAAPKRTHALHESITDIATRGLMRAVAESPLAGLTIVAAQLFSQLVIANGRRIDTASTISADPYSRSNMDQVPELDGEVYRLLEERKAAYDASGLSAIGWVESLEHHERMSLLSELVGVSLHAREYATHVRRAEARAQAEEIAELVGYDITNYWIPGADFLKQYNRAELANELTAMGGDAARGAGMKTKALLVDYVAEEAAERNYAPAELSWPSTKPVEATSETEQPGDADAATFAERQGKASGSEQLVAANENPAQPDEDQDLALAA